MACGRKAYVFVLCISPGLIEAKLFLLTMIYLLRAHTHWNILWRDKAYAKQNRLQKMCIGRREEIVVAICRRRDTMAREGV